MRIGTKSVLFGAAPYREFMTTEAKCLFHLEMVVWLSAPGGGRLDADAVRDRLKAATLVQRREALNRGRAGNPQFRPDELDQAAELLGLGGAL